MILKEIKESCKKAENKQQKNELKCFWFFQMKIFPNKPSMRKGFSPNFENFRKSVERSLQRTSSFFAEHFSVEKWFSTTIGILIVTFHSALLEITCNTIGTV